jgi:hypothetical protein
MKNGKFLTHINEPEMNALIVSNQWYRNQTQKQKGQHHEKVLPFLLIKELHRMRNTAERQNLRGMRLLFRFKK